MGVVEERKTSLSAGLAVRQLLLGSEAVTRHTRKIYPVVTDKAELPYILYRRASLAGNPTKAGSTGADTAQVEVCVYTGSYDEGVELAEAVRAEMDNITAAAYGRRVPAEVIPGLRLRGCVLTDSSEGWEDDAYVQILVFTIKI